jgi:hypothetical protein
MLSEEHIKQALHASRILPLGIANPHGPFGLEHLAEAVSSQAQPHPVTSSELAAVILEEAVDGKSPPNEDFR